MGEPIPGKGELLTRMALFWFDALEARRAEPPDRRRPESVVAADEREQVRGRSMLVKRLKPLPIEAVVRGYLAGCGWKEYQQRQARSAASRCRAGLKNASRLPAPIFTPATKAEAGEHDENIVVRAHGRRSSARRSPSAVREVSLAAVQRGGRLCADQGHHHRRHQVRVRPRRRRHADADGRGADARLVALLAGRELRARAPTRRATTSSSCATGSSRCASTASRGTSARRRRSCRPT